MLERFEFLCPYCNKEKVTFIEDSKFADIFPRRTKLIQEVFPPQYFPTAYRELFVSGMCSLCQNDMFEEKDFKPVDVDIDENTNELESYISEIYENIRD